MLFEIKKPMTAFLTIECNSKEEAEAWANKIVATLEHEDGSFVSSNEFIYFESETVVSGVSIMEIKS